MRIPLPSLNHHAHLILVDEDRIWSLEHHGELIPTWTNTDGSTIQPDIVLNEDTGVIALTGDHKALGQQDHSWKLVVCIFMDLV